MTRLSLIVLVSIGAVFFVCLGADDGDDTDPAHSDDAHDSETSTDLLNSPHFTDVSAAKADSGVDHEWRGTSGYGDDTIHGLAGDDLIKGGSGADSVYGGIGADTVFAGTGDGVVHGLAGDDLITGGGHDDILLYSNHIGSDAHVVFEGYGGAGNDQFNFLGDPGLADAPHDAIVSGDAGNDIISVSNGGDVTLSGGEGDEYIATSGVEHAVMSGGAGQDFFHVSATYNNPQDDGAVTITDFSPATETPELRITEDPDAIPGTPGDAVAILQADAAGTGTLVVYRDFVYAHLQGVQPDDIPDSAINIQLIARSHPHG